MPKKDELFLLEETNSSNSNHWDAIQGWDGLKNNTMERMHFVMLKNWRISQLKISENDKYDKHQVTARQGLLPPAMLQPNGPGTGEVSNSCNPVGGQRTTEAAGEVRPGCLPLRSQGCHGHLEKL